MDLLTTHLYKFIYMYSETKEYLKQIYTEEIWDYNIHFLKNKSNYIILRIQTL